LDRIAAAAMEIADAEGLPAVTMRPVAAALGTGPASLYRYVRTRDELIDLMVDAANGEIDLSGIPSGDWRADLLTLARRTRGVYLKHPWLLETAETPRPISPSVADYLEAALTALEGAGIDTRTMFEAIGVLNALVVMLTRAELTAADREAALQHERFFLRIAEGGAHPHIVAALSAGAAEAEREDAERQFDRVVTRVLRGLIEPGGPAALLCRPPGRRCRRGEGEGFVQGLAESGRRERDRDGREVGEGAEHERPADAAGAELRWGADPVVAREAIGAHGDTGPGDLVVEARDVHRHARFVQEGHREQLAAAERVEPGQLEARDHRSLGLQEVRFALDSGHRHRRFGDGPGQAQHHRHLPAADAEHAEIRGAERVLGVERAEGVLGERDDLGHFGVREVGLLDQDPRPGALVADYGEVAAAADHLVPSGAAGRRPERGRVAGLQVGRLVQAGKVGGVLRGHLRDSRPGPDARNAIRPAPVTRCRPGPAYSTTLLISKVITVFAGNAREKRLALTCVSV
jgi:AcrR family transcriptional regulator